MSFGIKERAKAKTKIESYFDYSTRGDGSDESFIYNAGVTEKNFPGQFSLLWYSFFEAFSYRDK